MSTEYDPAPRTRAALAAYTARLAIDPYPTYEGLTLYQAAAAELPALLARLERAEAALSAVQAAYRDCMDDPASGPIDGLATIAGLLDDYERAKEGE